MNSSYIQDSKWPRLVFAQSYDRTLTPLPTTHNHQQLAISVAVGVLNHQGLF